MFLKEAQENMLLEPQIYDAIHKLETGDASYLKIAFFAMAFEDREIVRNAGHGIRKCLEHATVAQMIMLNERFRNYSSFDSSIHWKKIDIREKKTWFHSEQDYLYVLILGSFHSDGYFREICATELYHYPNTLGYLLLRLNDWVPSIRKNMFLL